MSFILLQASQKSKKKQKQKTKNLKNTFNKKANSLFYCSNKKINYNNKNTEQIRCYKRNTVKKYKSFNDTLVLVYCVIISHQTMTRKKHPSGGPHTTLFLNEFQYISFFEKKLFTTIRTFQ